MVELVLGIVAAVGASTLYSLGVTIQALDAKEAPARELLRIALVWRLVRRSRWLVGTGLSMLGWPLQIVALLLAPLVVVQPALAVGLLVLLFFAQRLLGEHAGRNEHLAMGAIVIGVIAIGLTAPPRAAEHTSEHLTITLVLVGLGLLSMVPYLLRSVLHTSSSVIMVGAGLAYAWTGVSTKLASDDLSLGHPGLAIAWGVATAAASVVALLSEMSALQARPAIQVAPVVFVIQTIVPVALAPVLFGERFSDTPLYGIPLVLSLAMLVTGAVMLVRSPLLLALVEGERINFSSDSARSPYAASQDTTRSSPATEDGEPLTATTTTSPGRAGR
jgi:hypothetical protein